jgi:hypothetical protein
LGKLHGEPASAQIAPELLAKQYLDIGFVVDHEDEQAHGWLPDFNAATRGTIILNSVTGLGPLSTPNSPNFSRRFWSQVHVTPA